MPAIDSFFNSIDFRASSTTFPTLDKLDKAMSSLQEKTIGLQKSGLDSFTLSAAKGGSFVSIDRAHKALDTFMKSSGNGLTGSSLSKAHDALDDHIDFLRATMPMAELMQEGKKHQAKEEKIVQQKGKLQKDQDKSIKRDHDIFIEKRRFFNRFERQGAGLFGGLGEASLFGASAILPFYFLFKNIMDGVQKTANTSMFASTYQIDPRNLHILERSLSPYGVDAKQTDALAANIRNLQAQAAQGWGKGFDVFNNMGIRATDPRTHKLLPLESIISQAMAATSGLPQIIRLQRLNDLGITPQFFPAFSKGIYNIERKSRSTTFLTDDDFKKAQEFSIAWGETKSELSEITTLLEISFIPALEVINKHLQAILHPQQITKKEADKATKAYDKKVMEGSNSPFDDMAQVNMTFNIQGSGDHESIKKTVQDGVKQGMQHAARQLKSSARNKHGG